MVEAVLARARERGCGRVELDVDDDNAPARALYESAGFGEKHGGAAYMQRRL
jgi:ribosomal protein S18 acetylase RimI-like enzyme